MLFRTLFIFLLPTFLFGVQVPAQHVFPDHPHVSAPFFTGPLLAPSALTLPPGHINIEPYVFVVANTGRYNGNWKREKIETFWGNYFQPSIIAGLNSWLDFSFNPTLFYNYTKGAATWVFGDMPMGFDIQLYRHNKVLTDWGTALLLQVKEILPLGKYQNLNPNKKGTDVGGGGSFQTQINLVWGNLFYIGGIRFITWRTALQCTLPAPVHVKNLNAYGGGIGTRGTVYPAQSLSLDTAFEVTLSQHWVFAMDIVGSWFKKVRFKGESSSINTAPAAVQFSLAPAIEYNWNSNLGLIFGSWFSIAGKNAFHFVNGVVAFNYYY